MFDLLASTSSSTDIASGFDYGNLLMVIGVFGAFVISVISILYTHSARGEMRKQTTESKRLSDVTEQALSLQRDELDLHRKELSERDRLFLLTRPERIMRS